MLTKSPVPSLMQNIGDNQYPSWESQFSTQIPAETLLVVALNRIQPPLIRHRAFVGEAARAVRQGEVSPQAVIEETN
jgi:hypothetical protein